MTLAAVVGAHGIGGEVRLKLFTDDLGPYRSMMADDRTLTLLKVKPGANGAIARFAEIPDRTAAEALRGLALTVPRSALPALADGEYYHDDLVGLAAMTSDGMPLGIVVAVENFGAGDVIEIERSGGARFMVPMRPEAVPTWDTERLTVASDFAAQYVHAVHTDMQRAMAGGQGVGVLRPDSSLAADPLDRVRLIATRPPYFAGMPGARMEARTMPPELAA